MPNIQQPEMRRSGRDPLVQDSREGTAASAPLPGGGPAGPVPPDQQSPYGPQPPTERRPAVDEGYDAVLVGGPQDALAFHAESAAVVTLEEDGLIHRYIRTTQHRERDGRQLLVYNYDGEVRE